MKWNNFNSKLRKSFILSLPFFMHVFHFKKAHSVTNKHLRFNLLISYFKIFFFLLQISYFFYFVKFMSWSEPVSISARRFLSKTEFRLDNWYSHAHRSRHGLPPQQTNDSQRSSKQEHIYRRLQSSSRWLRTLFAQLNHSSLQETQVTRSKPPTL